jgi:hypothetical protein
MTANFMVMIVFMIVMAMIVRVIVSFIVVIKFMIMPVIVVVLRVVGVMVVPFQLHDGARPPDAATLLTPEGERPPVDAELPELRAEPVGINAQVHEGAKGHVARDAGETIEMQSLHASSRRARFMFPME